MNDPVSLKDWGISQSWCSRCGKPTGRASMVFSVCVLCAERILIELKTMVERAWMRPYDLNEIQDSMGKMQHMLMNVPVKQREEAHD